MQKTFKAIYQKGEIVPLEDIQLQEKSRLLVFVLDAPHKKYAPDSWLSLKGKYADTLSTVDEFMAQKKIEKE